MILPIFDTFRDIIKNDESLKEQKAKLNRLFQVILDEALVDERIHFTSLFSKLAYLGVRYELEGQFLYELHQLRKKIEKPDGQKMLEDVKLLSFLIPHLYSELTHTAIPVEIQKITPKESGLTSKRNEIEKFIPFTKMLCTRIDKKSYSLHGFIEDSAEKEVTVLYNISDRNERFTSNLEQLATRKDPFLLELIDIEMGLDGSLRPAAFVIEPDFLVDVTAVASCFSHDGARTVAYIYKKFLPMSWSKPLLVGNIANYYLDRLVANPSLTFDEILTDLFQLDPLAFARIEDHEMPSLMQDMKKHFNNIQRSLTTDFPRETINLDHVYLEPSFISAQYGLQGRLDLLQMDDDYTSIIELKSGGIFKPNVYGLKNDHYVQTLLYDLLIRSAFINVKPRNYILYSKESSKTLRIAPRIAAQQKEAMKVRNDLLEIEMDLSDEKKTESLLNSVNTKLYEDVKGFEATNITNFELRYGGLDRLEKDYFNAFVNFIALEHRLSKIGQYGQDRSNGLAGLWLDSHEEKCEQFNMITNLRIESNSTSSESPTLTLVYTEDTNKLSNFRAGDIVILYPLLDTYDSPLRNQVFKCTIIDFQDERITIKLRSQQRNQAIFVENARWALEHDAMDSSFTGMYRQLYAWAGAPKAKRDLVLTRRAPSQPKTVSELKLNYDGLTEEQNQLLERMIQSEEYYLVWGPPGTGKTSRMISHYIKHIIDETDENLYILGYTNRAVDELCEAIHSLGESYEENYIRIGSSYGTESRFTNKLLQSKIKGIGRRKELRSFISKHRIVVGTISSMLNKEIIFELIKPSRVIIDEASQILEPNVVGLLTGFEHFVLVGDHRQLPAVVVQEPAYSEVQNDRLHKIGLRDRRDSLFERMYRKAISLGWDHAIGQLQYQGRMHENIMEFPNAQFYENKLKVLPGISRLSEAYKSSKEANIYQSKRKLFKQIDVPIKERFSKTNSAEVEAVKRAILEFENLGYSLKEIGVITPFRAQIAAIKEVLYSQGDRYKEITVDTVERFQGSARQVIIVSFCCNSAIQFRSMVSLSSEGIDRKLNVAMTRAKEQMMLIGDQKILRMNPLYDELIDSCAEV